MAYGDNAVVSVHKDGSADVQTEGVVVPNGPVYAKLPTPKKVAAKDEKAPATDAGNAHAQKPASPPKGAPKSGQGSSKDQADKGKSKGADAPEAGSMSEDPYYPSSGKNVYEDEGDLKDVLPPALDNLVDSVTTFTLWLDVASPGTPEAVSLVQDGRLMMAVEAPLANDLTLTTTVTAPIDEGPHVEPVVTSVVTDTGTGEVLAKDTETCPNAHSVSAVAIGQTVDVVLEAREAE